MSAFDVLEQLRVADTTSEEQRQYFYALTHMLADAHRPYDREEMSEGITRLRRELRRTARQLEVPFAKWEEECGRRLKKVLWYLGEDPAKLVPPTDEPDDEESEGVAEEPKITRPKPRRKKRRPAPKRQAVNPDDEEEE